MTKPKHLPANVIVRQILVTDLAQQMKKQRDFFRWMARKYSKPGEEQNLAQSAAFTTGAEKFDELRQDLLEGLFDVDPRRREELFTRAAAQQLKKTPAHLEELTELPAYELET